jgi:hypothetical protein
MSSIDPSVDFVQNVKLPSLPHGATNVSNSEVVLNEDNIILSKEVIYPNDNVSSNDDLDLNQLFK